MRISDWSSDVCSSDLSYDPVDKNAGCMDVIGVKLAGRYDFFDFGDRCIRSRGHVRIEIASCLAKHEIPLRVCSPCLDNCEIGSQPPLAKISHAVEFLRHLSFGNNRSNPCPRVECGNAR